MLFDSRGFKDAAEVKGAELEASLLAASQGGKIPIVCDTSPCLSQIKNGLSDGKLKCVSYPFCPTMYLLSPVVECILNVSTVPHYPALQSTILPFKV